MTFRNIAGSLLAVALSGGVAAAAPTQQQLAHQAKITMPAARAIALKGLPGGKVVGQELETEKGGSGLRYSFDIRWHGKTREVGVDAKTGKVLENNVEGKNPD
ncbi:MAG: PepSY domain-containing protein [Candidatus Baltobacteraceae bacterium]